VRRLRIARPQQLELPSDDPGRDAGVAWATLPEPNRDRVLVVLARMIGSGIADDTEKEEAS
jgi:hypothetical protein